jgi:hypothetical protein
MCISLFYIIDYNPLGIFQQQLNRATTPQEHQLPMQDSTCKSQHQLRT